MKMLNAVKLIDACIEHKIIMRDPERKDNIIVWYANDIDYPDGWYSVNILTAAGELCYNFEGQTVLISSLKEKGIDFKEDPSLDELIGIDCTEEKESYFERL